ncbi:DNA/RNA polymerase [Basidiobolus meristosporus CBS 931.73]|uniref:DNA-directed DNA polymerase n=1 Tax=Basidiobolus meristosporus CBS 931.73 TaxID=1314790 RepID=A0A1Y1Y0L1_9FUNG|nr:DNA/RNA polymerase [Basidiobolus meristosporus CBS 931.73]|eukprot:ORX91256.1 DNA/RNA polymerase [Basidiobolus meristosporus CBS 931.73]
MGFEKNKYFSHLGRVESISCMGRKYLDQIVTHISCNYPVRVIYGDTDSCLIIPTSPIPASNYIQLCHDICKDGTRMLPQPMAINFKEYYDIIILMSKKRYIMYKNHTLKYKGVMNAQQGYCQFAKDLYSTTITNMVNNFPKFRLFLMLINILQIV